MAKRKKAQVWYIDFMVGLLILIMTIMIYYQYHGNLNDESEADWQEMTIDSKFISSSLMSGGYPSNWTNETVETIGLTDENYRINETKIQQFANMSYKQAKEVLRTRFNFYFSLQNSSGASVYTAGLNATDQKFLVQTMRFVIYNSSISRMVLYIWS